MANIGGQTRPAFLVPIVEMGLMRVDEPDDQSVDAGVVNPRSMELVN
jgi:hypothetical protein